MAVHEIDYWKEDRVEFFGKEALKSLQKYLEDGAVANAAENNAALKERRQKLISKVKEIVKLENIILEKYISTSSKGLGHRIVGTIKNFFRNFTSLKSVKAKLIKLMRDCVNLLNGIPEVKRVTPNSIRDDLSAATRAASSIISINTVISNLVLARKIFENSIKLLNGNRVFGYDENNDPSYYPDLVNFGIMEPKAHPPFKL